MCVWGGGGHRVGMGGKFSCLYRCKQNKLPLGSYPAELMQDSCMQGGFLTIAATAGFFSANWINICCAAQISGNFRKTAAQTLHLSPSSSNSAFMHSRVRLIIYAQWFCARACDACRWGGGPHGDNMGNIFILGLQPRWGRGVEDEDDWKRLRKGEIVPNTDVDPLKASQGGGGIFGHAHTMTGGVLTCDYWWWS